jgi:hypothetical protein
MGGGRRLAEMAVIVAVAITAGLTGCSSPGANAEGLEVGDCLRLGGAPDQPEAAKVACGSRASNFKVVATFKGEARREQCPTDVDSSYSMRKGFRDSGNTACLDIDWVVGSCMSVDPANHSGPIRVDCNDRSAPHRQRATQILKDLRSPVGVDQCTSGLGYAYAQRRFAVCVEDVA